MIVVKLYGGLGNQLFQYAFGISNSNTTEQELFFDVTNGYEGDFFERSFVLEKLGLVVPKIPQTFQTNLFFGNAISSKIWRKILSIVPASYKSYYREKEKFLLDNEVFCVGMNTYFDGYWQNYKYFDEAKPLIQKDVFESIDKPITDLLQTSSNAEIVCVHMRYPHAYVGDKVHSGASESFEILEFSYFEESIEFILNSIDKPVFYFFSDNLPWARERISNLSFPINSFFAEAGSDVDHFKLMVQCDHFIISNSTFSWWAAYLGENDSKKIVSPKFWYKNLDLTDYGFFPADWTLIKNR
jgi:hypothetical protein